MGIILVSLERPVILNAEHAGICEPHLVSSHDVIDTAKVVKVSTEMLSLWDTPVHDAP